MRACDCLVICSDGFERVYAENEELFREIIFGDDSPWSRLSALVALLASPAQGEYDDRTVVLLRPAAESE
jgi:serine/threonine protein phosphatase PrpC